MRQRMHNASGEDEEGREREEEKEGGVELPGWACGCETKTSGGQVENADLHSYYQ